MLDPLQVSVDGLRRRQLAALRGELPDTFEGHRRRLASATLTGLSIIGELTDAAPHLQQLVTEVATIAERDPRFSFLNALPEGPALSMMRALALERATFATETPEVARLALLMGMFTLLLDGLLDEAPETLRPLRSWLDATMDPDAWDAGRTPRPPEPSGHPVADALCWLAAETIATLTHQPGWRDDALVREQFAAATRAAYRAELASLDCRMSDNPAPLADVEQRVLAKSTAPIWAGSLIPFCVHGWPASIDPAAFAELAGEIGRFGGWLDDVVDVAVDLRADRWSMALLTLHAIVRELRPAANGHDPRLPIVELLGFPFVGEHVAELGVARLRAVRAALAANGIAEDALLPVLADVATACLTDGLPGREN